MVPSALNPKPNVSGRACSFDKGCSVSAEALRAIAIHWAQVYVVHGPLGLLIYSKTPALRLHQQVRWHSGRSCSFCVLGDRGSSGFGV